MKYDKCDDDDDDDDIELIHECVHRWNIELFYPFLVIKEFFIFNMTLSLYLCCIWYNMEVRLL